MKVAVVTGGTSGIGAVAAETLARCGIRIILIARDRTRGERMLERLRTCAPGVEHAVHYADLSLLAETRRVGAEIAQGEPRIDVLINNAGAMYARMSLTSEGLERTFALNHMSYFLLTHQLCDRLAAAAPARIVNTASGAHHRARPDWADLQSVRHYSALQAYSRSKLYNILFTRELARRLAGRGITANCLHPGFVATRFGDEGGGLVSLGLRVLKRFAISADEGARTIAYLATAEEVSGRTGGYYYKNRPARPTGQAQDDQAAARLWSESARLAGIQ